MGPDQNGTISIISDTWTAEEVFEATYTVATFILGFTGNLFVLITSHLYNSIDMDAVTIVFVRQLAVADFLAIINTVLPTVITMFTGKWVLGDLLCDITGHFNFIPVMVNIYLVLNLSIFKILMCKMPFRMRDLTTTHAWLLVLLSYLLAGVEFFESIFLAKSGMYAPPVSRCISKIYVTHPTLMLWNAAIPVGVPLLVIIFCNLWIYKVARKVVRARGQGSHSRALLTICAVSGLFVISWTPKLIYVTVVTITKKQIPWAVKISHFFPFINSVGNPFIYTFTNKRYSEFVFNLFTKFKITATETSSGIFTKMSELKSSRAVSSPGFTSKYHRGIGEASSSVGNKPLDKLVGPSSDAAFGGRSDGKKEELQILSKKKLKENGDTETDDGIRTGQLDIEKKSLGSSDGLLEKEGLPQNKTGEVPETLSDKGALLENREPQKQGMSQENAEPFEELIDNSLNPEKEEILGVYIVGSMSDLDSIQ